MSKILVVCDQGKLPARILSKFTIDDNGCWIWTAAITGGGYGYINWQRKPQKAMRLLYDWLVGPIPDGYQLDHLCRVRACVNPEHLEPVTSRENTMRGENPSAAKAKQTHCYKGHEFDEKNTYRRPNGTRVCRTCHRDYQRANWKRFRKNV